MLPDGGDGGSASGLGGSIVMDPGAAVRQVMTPDVRRQSYLVDESGRLMILRPSSVVSGPGEPMQMVYLGEFHLFRCLMVLNVRNQMVQLGNHISGFVFSFKASVMGDDGLRRPDRRACR